MATILEALKGINAYPIPRNVIDEIAGKRNLFVGEYAFFDVLQSKEYNLAKADLLIWLSTAPNVSQGGQNYSFSDEQRKLLINRAYGIYSRFADNETEKTKPIYGYKGSRL